MSNNTLLPPFSRLDGALVDLTRVKDPALLARVNAFLSSGRSKETFALRDRIESGFYSKFITAADKNILDIGAGIGLFSIYVSPQVTTVLSVEQNDEQYHLLADLSMSFAGKLCGHSFLHANVDKGDIDNGEYKSISLNSLLNYYGENGATIDLMRVNTYSFEREVLSHTDLVKLRKTCRAVLVEIAEPNCLDVSDEYWVMLRRAGYKVRNVNPKTLFAT